MSKVLLNTLFVNTEGAHARLDGDTIRVELEGESLLRVPLHHVGAVILFGECTATAPLMARCVQEGRSFVYLDRGGRFKARVEGPVSGNVLLRKAQWEAMLHPPTTLEIARSFVAGKLQNSRQVLLRGARDLESAGKVEPLVRTAAAELEQALALVPRAEDLDQLRGIEGDAAQSYFGVFDALITARRTEFRFDGRSRRPPRDRMNALLSFLYSLGVGDCAGALQGVGLDPQAGFLHALRPGRPALALDLVEEFRAILHDRLALTLVNRNELSADDFSEREGGAVLLTDEGRKKVLVAYQKRKQAEVPHRLLKTKVPVGLLPHLQARLLARHLRGDSQTYEPYLPR